MYQLNDKIEKILVDNRNQLKRLLLFSKSTGLTFLLQSTFHNLYLETQKIYMTDGKKN